MTQSETDADGALDAVSACLRGRRTVALFDDRPVDEKIVLEAIDHARWAPNHRVTQPWHFYLLGEAARAATVDLVRVVTTERSDAANGKRKAQRWRTIPGLMVVTCEASADPLLQLEDYAACCCAVQNMALYLWQSGVGMKWTSGPIIRDARYYAALGIDAAERTIVGLMFYGYPRTVPEQRRRSVKRIVTRLA